MSAAAAVGQRRGLARAAREALAGKLRDRGISDERVLGAIAAVPRHRFTEEGFTHLAYEDQSLSIGHGQTISQPWIVALMTQALMAKNGPGQVLEVGTGSGYQAAVLATLAPRVFTIERIPALYRRARALLDELGYDNVHFRCGDGAKGWKQFAPFDAVIVTAAAAEIPPPLLGQLAIGGRLVAPVGGRDGAQELVLVARSRRGYSERRLCSVKFVPLVGLCGE